VANWIVLVEAVSHPPAAPIDWTSLRLLLEAVEAHPGALHTPDRCAVRLDIAAVDAEDAVTIALTRWRRMLASLELPYWPVVRAEVLSPEEFDRDAQQADPASLATMLTISERRPPEGESVAKQLLDRVFSDPLTGLPTGETLQSRLGHALLPPGGGARHVTVACYDVDASDGGDDRRGQVVGDQVLVTLAQRLARGLRPQDTVMRFGESGFAILIEKTPADEALGVARRTHDGLCQPVVVESQEVVVPAISAGVAVAGDGEPPEAILSNVEAALSRAKELGGNRLERFTSSSPRPHASRTRVASAPTHDRLAYLLLLQQAAAAANESNSIEEASEPVIRQVCTYLGFQVGRLYLVSPDRPGHQLVASVTVDDCGGLGQAPANEGPVVASANQGLVGRVLATAAPAWDTEAPAHSPGGSEVGTADGRSLALAIPVLVGREVLGVLEFTTDETVEPSRLLLEVLGALGTQLGRVVERHRAEQALRESEFQLREAQRLAGLASWRKDFRTGRGFLSPELYDILGWNGPTASLDEFFASMVHPEDRSDLQARHEHVFQTGGVSEVAFRIVRPDGVVRWVRGRTSADHDTAGRVISLHGTLQDVTEQKLAEEALLNQRRQLAEAERVGRLGSWERDLRTDRFTWSDELWRQWGLDRSADEEPPSLEEFVAHVHPEDVPKFHEAIERLFESDSELSVDVRLTPPGGQERWIRSRARVIRDPSGTPVRVVGTAQDVTDEKRAEAELAASHERYRRMLELTHEGVWVIDENSLTTFVNGRMAAMLGYSREEMLGMPASAFVDEELLSLAQADLRRQQMSGVSEQLEATLKKKSGGTVAVLLSSTPLFDAAGTYAGALAMVNDVDETKRRRYP
jgi:diguanylate cyclase (GGDEF)-like protein/PAS domain S-box-containing protein